MGPCAGLVRRASGCALSLRITTKIERKAHQNNGKIMKITRLKKQKRYRRHKLKIQNCG